MQIEVSVEFLELCGEILAEAKSPEEWAEIESDDMFQTPSFEGGFDATEMAFCFSFRDSESRQYWFQLTLDEITAVHAGRLRYLSVRPAERFS